jgi:mono/diheme cytochrome c family protein
MTHVRRFRVLPAMMSLAIAALLVTTAARLAPSQPAAPVAPTFTAEQVELGQAAYRRNCVDCHGTNLDNGEFGGPALKGFYFRQKWAAGGVGALYSFTKGLMPPDRPGQLSEQTYVDLIAFILSNNGYTPGDKALPADPAAMQNMGIKP